MNKPCESCRKKDEELARLRAAQGDQIKAHVHDAEHKNDLDMQRWAYRVDQLLGLLKKQMGVNI